MESNATIPQRIHLFTEYDLEVFSQNIIKKALAEYQLYTYGIAPKAENEVLTLKEAETVTRYKAGTLRKLAQQNKIPHSRPNGKNLVFFKSELMEWLRTNSNNPKQVH